MRSVSAYRGVDTAQVLGCRKGYEMTGSPAVFRRQYAACVAGK